MSSILVHRIDDIARRHIARIAQIEALPPQLTRGDFNAWDFNRPAFKHFTTRLPGRDRFDGGLTGEPAPGGESGVPDSTIEPCLQSRSITFFMAGASIVGTVKFALSSAIIPFDFKITEVISWLMLNTGGALLTYNFFVANEDYTNDIITILPSGPRVFEVKDPETGIGLGPAFDASIIGPEVVGSSAASGHRRVDAGPFPASSRLICVMSSHSTTAGNLRYEFGVSITECPRARVIYGAPGPGPTPGPGPVPVPGPGAPPGDWQEIF